ncbi:MAG: TfoX family protein [Calditrichaeota bacterium]|nr:MAG: TfoX family protein [Calditrichota bacterium]
MASDISFVRFVCDQLRNAGDVEYKKMFGEYGLYLDGKIFALVCDNRLFIKPTPQGRQWLGEPDEAPPYPGAKNYFSMDNLLDDAGRLSELARITVTALPAPRPKRKKP